MVMGDATHVLGQIESAGERRANRKTTSRKSWFNWFGGASQGHRLATLGIPLITLWTLLDIPQLGVSTEKRNRQNKLQLPLPPSVRLATKWVPLPSSLRRLWFYSTR